MGNKEAAAKKIRRLEEQIAKKKAALIREKGRLSEKERKARTRNLIQIGGLAEIAELAESDHGFLLGYLMQAKDISPDSGDWKRLKAKGDSILKEREAARKKQSRAGQEWPTT